MSNEREADTAVTIDRKPECFVISPIGEEKSETRWKSDRVLRYIVERALGDKYSVKRADDIRRPGIVTSQIIQALLTAELVVADLSQANPNVYYELAIRHAANKPVVHMISKGESTPFDVSAMRYVNFDIGDPQSVEEARQQLRDHVAAIETGEPVLTPIQFTQILTAPATHAGEKENELLKVFANSIANISEELREIKQLVDRGQWKVLESGSGKTGTFLSSLLDTAIAEERAKKAGRAWKANTISAILKKQEGKK